jgi:hypothetical protein
VEVECRGGAMENNNIYTKFHPIPDMVMIFINYVLNSLLN